MGAFKAAKEIREATGRLLRPQWRHRLVQKQPMAMVLERGKKAGVREIFQKRVVSISGFSGHELLAAV
eukprot:CAMPEP_0185793284 /NCGR_PEP_ID=MMETSP1174-20130828/159390_1 /TAXON_ID=35687 /ORGANISM="Dictyocha speculum, Strain CCMP1381" /LENGTH=67 /DNA_ID=CAMNT_0028488415 /DNA_START=247 /DNA_END=450 /DNA_ORIENTATION=-